MIAVQLPHGGKGKTLGELGLTLVHPFYNERERFKLQMSNWELFSDAVKDSLQINVVDDCSLPSMETWVDREIDYNLDIHRVRDNLKWNTPGALNLGILHANTEWVLIMDSDCMFKPDVMEQLMTLRPVKKCHYYFPRKRITKDAIQAINTRFLPCTILFNKETYEDVGGFDEDFTGQWSGGYGFFDNYFSARLREISRDRVLEDVVATEYMESEIGPNVQQREKVKHSNLVINKKIMYDKLKGILPPRSKRLRFRSRTTLSHRRDNDLH